MSGIETVQSRIAQIESRLAALSAPRALAAGTRATGAGAVVASGGDAFAEQLRTALGAGATGTAGAAGAGRTSAASDGGASAAARVVATARQWLGVPYRWGGGDPKTGLDCSGLVQRAFESVGVSLPRHSADQARAGTRVESLAQARPGDLIYFASPKHIGIYVGDGRMLHAPKAGDVVKISEVWKTPTAIRRVVGGVASAGGAAYSGAVPATGSRSSSGRAEWSRLMAAAEVRNGLPRGLLSAVARVESNWRADAVSPAGAIGLMQIMPGTARELGVNPRDPAQAIDGAGRLLGSHLRRFDSLELALAAYNAGPGAVSRHGGVPPYRETQAYVRRVVAALQEVRP